MNKLIHLIIPMSGQGVRYQKAGYFEPKPMIPVSYVPMVERLLLNFPVSWICHFVLAESHKNTSLPGHLLKLRPNANLSYVKQHNQGPGYPVRAVIESIPHDDAVFVSYCDYGMVWDSFQFENFVRQSDCDSCVVCYRGFHPHYLNSQTYAYCRMNGDLVCEVREKGSFTDCRENEYASSGGYYFRSALLLKKALDYQMANNLKLNGEYYISLTVQAFLQSTAQAHVRVFEIPYFFQWGTPSDLQRFEYWEKTYNAYNKFIPNFWSVDQVMITMAGCGSRFKEYTKTPKPLISVGAEPMFISALHSLPRSKRTVIVLLKEIEELVKSRINSDTILCCLDKTPEGQALSAEIGARKLNIEKEVIVSSCDHGVVLDPLMWKHFVEQKDNCDAAIFTINGFPGVSDKPEAYAYVLPENSNKTCPLIKNVLVKKPLSKTPQKDNVLVGTFWFKSGELLLEIINELKQKNIRVNNELYLDSALDLLVKKGGRVRMIKLDGYICWGDPDIMSEALYWREVFCGSSSYKRPKLPGI